MLSFTGPGRYIVNHQKDVVLCDRPCNYSPSSGFTCSLSTVPEKKESAPPESVNYSVRYGMSKGAIIVNDTVEVDISRCRFVRMDGKGIVRVGGRESEADSKARGVAPPVAPTDAQLKQQDWKAIWPPQLILEGMDERCKRVEELPVLHCEALPRHELDPRICHLILLAIHNP